MSLQWVLQCANIFSQVHMIVCAATIYSWNALKVQRETLVEKMSLKSFGRLHNADSPREAEGWHCTF